MKRINSYSKSVLQYEYDINNLIAILLTTFIKLHNDKAIVSPTDAQLKIFNILSGLKDREIEELVNLINIINSGVFKYLNKYLIIDVVLPESFQSGNKYLICGYTTLANPSVFRKIDKKLLKEKHLLISLDGNEDNIIDVKSTFNEAIHNLNLLLNEIIPESEPTNFKQNLNEAIDSLDSVFSKLKLDIVSRFSNI